MLGRAILSSGVVSLLIAAAPQGEAREQTLLRRHSDAATEPAVEASSVAGRVFLAADQSEIPIQLRGLKVEPVDIRFYRDGSCKVRFSLLNLTTETLTVSAASYLVDRHGNSIGSASLFFPPALPGKTSFQDVTFYASMLAGRCSRPITIRIQPEVCQFASGTYLSPRSCRIAGEASYLSR